MFDFDSILMLTGLLTIISLVYFYRQNDELPLVLTFLYISGGVSRYWAVINGNSYWAYVAYSRNIFEMSNELGLVALNVFLMGTAVFVLSYILWSSVIPRPTFTIDHKGLFKRYVLTRRTVILILFSIFFIISFYTKVLLGSLLSTGSTLSTNISYLYYLPFAIGGVILLLFMVFRNIEIKNDGLSKLVFAVMIVILGYVSYNPIARFSFLSWAVALGVIFMKDKAPGLKIRVYSVGLVLLLTVFSLAGLYRTPGASTQPIGVQLDMAWERFKTAEDQNLLDGLMMVLQVYPKNLNYQYGFQHLEILLRPIPRVLWPGKPLGGYANKLGLNDNMQYGGTVGISESLYGTFYGEGGIIGIILISFIYGFIYAKINRSAERYKSDIQYLIKGMLLASTTAIIRGGDLAGIVAFICMSYWPVFIFIGQYKGFTIKYTLWYQKFNRLRSGFQQTQDTQPVG